jgi:hypothetical protein
MSYSFSKPAKILLKVNCFFYPIWKNIQPLSEESGPQEVNLELTPEVPQKSFPMRNYAKVMEWWSNGVMIKTYSS